MDICIDNSDQIEVDYFVNDDFDVFEKVLDALNCIRNWFYVHFYGNEVHDPNVIKLDKEVF